MKQKQSEIINFNVIMTIVVVILHCNSIEYAKDTIKYYNFVKNVNLFITMFCNIAVPVFICISSYLFFKNYDNTQFFSKIKKKIKTLVIPYLFWSIVSWIYALFLLKSGILDMFPNHFNRVSLSPLKIIKAIILSEYNPVMWYVRVLFCLMLLSPIIFYLIKKLKSFNIPILILLSGGVNLFNVSYYSFIYWLPLFYISTYVTILHGNFIKKFMMDSRNKTMFSVIMLFVLTYISYLYVDNYYVTYFYKIITPYFVLKLDFIKNLKCKTISTLSKYTFLIYATHGNVLSVVRKMWSLISLKDPIILLIYRFCTAFSTIFLIVIVFKILNKLFPKFTSMISGGRL